MTYIEAILAMSKGKKVKRESWDSINTIHMEGHILKNGYGIVFVPSYESMVSNDWVVAKKTITREFNVFLSLPMNDRNKEDILEDKAKYFAGFKKFLAENAKSFGISDEVDFIVKLNDLNDDIFERNSGNTRLNNLGISIGNMSFADFIIFSEDYYSSKGCCIERRVSKDFNEDFGWRVFMAHNYSDYTEV